MKRLIALVLLFALALAQGLEAFWKAVEVPGGLPLPLLREPRGPQEGGR